MIFMCPIARLPDVCGYNAGAAYSLKWPYLRKRALKRRYCASMAAKTRFLGSYVAILAGNRGYRACSERYGQKEKVRVRVDALKCVNLNTDKEMLLIFAVS